MNGRRLSAVRDRGPIDRPIMARGLCDNATLSPEARGFMAWFGMRLVEAGSDYRWDDAPDQKTIAAQFGTKLRNLQRIIAELREAQYLAMQRVTWNNRIVYFRRSPQVAFAFDKQPSGKAICGASGEATFGDKQPSGTATYGGSGAATFGATSRLFLTTASPRSSNPPGLSNTASASRTDAREQATDDENLLLILKKHGVMAHVAAEIAAIRTADEIADWIAAVPFHIRDTGGALFKTTAAVLVWALGAKAGANPRPLPESFVARRARDRAQLELQTNAVDAARAAIADPEQTAEERRAIARAHAPEFIRRKVEARG